MLAVRLPTDVHTLSTTCETANVLLIFQESISVLRFRDPILFTLQSFPRESFFVLGLRALPRSTAIYDVYPSDRAAKEKEMRVTLAVRSPFP